MKASDFLGALVAQDEGAVGPVGMVDPVDPAAPSALSEGGERIADIASQQSAFGADPRLASGAKPPSESAVTRDVTPSGIEIAYRSDPRTYWVNGKEAVSVTTVLDVLNKGGLTIWGMRVGIQGVLTLFERGHLTTEVDWETEKECVAVSAGHPASTELVEGLMKIEGLRTNDVKESASDRGQNVHNALEDWAKTGKLPRAHEFPPEEQGYVEGIVKFLEDADPTPVRTEVMVGSVVYGFAGRYDLEIELTETRKVRLTPKQKWQEVPPGYYLIDCKSAKDVYPDTNFRQLGGYEGARLECGYPPTDAQYVLNVNGEGSYQFRKSTAKYGDFLDVLAVFRGNKNLAKKVAA